MPVVDKQHPKIAGHPRRYNARTKRDAWPELRSTSQGPHCTSDACACHGTGATNQPAPCRSGAGFPTSCACPLAIWQEPAHQQPDFPLLSVVDLDRRTRGIAGIAMPVAAGPRHTYNRIQTCIYHAQWRMCHLQAGYCALCCTFLVRWSEESVVQKSLK